MKWTNEQPSIARQRRGKHVPAATNTQATIEVLLGYDDVNGVFCRSAPRLYNEDPRPDKIIIEGVS
jgi:hypothetical protein